MTQDDKIIQDLREHISALEKDPIVLKYNTYVSALNTILGLNGVINSSIPSNTLNLFGDKVRQPEEVKSYKKQVADIFREKVKFLHIREIIQIAKDKGLNIDDKSIKQAVYALKTDEVIVNVSINNSYQNTFWGSKNWLDSKGGIKPEHMYNEKLVANQKESIEI